MAPIKAASSANPFARDEWEAEVSTPEPDLDCAEGTALAPLLRLGLGWPAQLVETLDSTDPGMHLLCWKEGGPW